MKSVILSLFLLMRLHALCFHACRAVQMSLVTGSDNLGNKVVEMLGRSLPHIVPNVLLNKREVMTFFLFNKNHREKCYTI